VVLFAQDDCAAACLAPLAASKSQVLGVSIPGASSCANFSKRCAELGFDCLVLQDAEVVKMVVTNFKPEFLLCLPVGQTPIQSFMTLAVPEARKYLLRFGADAADAPWPEFAPIWWEMAASFVSLVSLSGEDESTIVREQVSVVPGETALSLRVKHADTAARVLGQLLEGAPLPVVTEDRPEMASLSSADFPKMISVEWDDVKVERYVRACTLPPNKPAEVADPNSGEVYFIESMPQYYVFMSKVFEDRSPQSKDDDSKTKLYAADTHWYSNMGGTIVKIGDRNQHMPRKASEGAMKMTIPGATVGSARQKLRMNEPLIGANAERYCASALASGWIGVEGPFVKRFEAQLATICGCAAACVVQSGTAALYGAMKALGVSEASQHVIVPAFTCAAAADAVVHAGGTPIPVDCELDTYGNSAEAVRAALESNPKIVGVVVAHCYGVPIRDLREIQVLCQERGYWLCEDACESYGALMRPPSGDSAASAVPVGSVGTLSVVSVRSEKMIGVGEGGAIVGNDNTLVARAKWWCSRAPCRGGGLWRVYEHEGIGQNFRLPEMLAAVGCAAAEMLPSVIDRKRRIHSWYEKYTQCPGLANAKLQAVAPGDEAVWWINSILMPEGISGEAVGMQVMKDYPDIEIRPGFFPLDQMAIFKNAAVLPCPNTDLLFSRLVCLPSSVQLQEPHVERVCGALEASLAKVSQLGEAKS